MRRFGYENIFEHHTVVSGMEVLKEVRTWNVENIFYTVGAQTFNGEEIRGVVKEALRNGANGLFVVSGSAAKRKFFTILSMVLRAPAVTAITLGISRLVAAQIRRTYLSMNSDEILDLIRIMKINGEIPADVPVWAAFNPYLDRVERAEAKVFKGAVKILTQPLICLLYTSRCV